ncbi:MAG TPA: PEP-CTERM sorting domain-containing protein [bacterium]|nr:PEP-CTERM sorting domain-containing protein [bacterium]
MRLRLAAIMFVGVTALLGAPALASAAVIVFDFSDCSEISGPPGFLCPNTDSTKTTLTYTRSGLSITANGYNTAGGGAHLYVKQEGYGETGLGIAADVNHEINPYYVIDLNMTDLTNHGITSGILNLESVQSGESYKVCEGHAPGSVGTVDCQAGSGGLNDSIAIDWTSANYLIGITAPTGNVLIASSIVVTPEPATIALFGAGVAGLGLIRRPKRFGRAAK